jgi:hypothetical protein
MKAYAVFSAVLACTLVVVVVGQSANFAGEWSYDDTKTMTANASGGASHARGGFYAGLRIVQDSSKLTVHTTGQAGEVRETTVYLFDGSEWTQPGGLKKTTARWDGEKLITKVVYTSRSDPATYQVTWYRDGEFLVGEEQLAGGRSKKSYYKHSR